MLIALVENVEVVDECPIEIEQDTRKKGGHTKTGMTRWPGERKREITRSGRGDSWWARMFDGAGRSGLGACILALWGCANPVSPEEIQLHAVSSEAVVSVTMTSGEGLPVAFQISVSETLDQPEMVVREVGTGLWYSPRNQWSEPLKDDLGRLFRTRLASAPEVSRILSPELESDVSPVLLVTVRVDRFEGERLPGGTGRGVVDATWRISRPDDRSGPALSSGLFVREADSWDGEDFEALKHLLQQLAADLADAVAKSLGESLGMLDRNDIPGPAPMTGQTRSP